MLNIHVVISYILLLNSNFFRNELSREQATSRYTIIPPTHYNRSTFRFFYVSCAYYPLTATIIKSCKYYC